MKVDPENFVPVVAICAVILFIIYGFYDMKVVTEEREQEINHRKQQERQQAKEFNDKRIELTNISILDGTIFRQYQDYKIRKYNNKTIENVVVDYYLDISKPMTFKGCTFTNFMVRDQDLNNITFENCTFNNSKFFNLNIGSVSMFNCTFNNSEFAVCYFGENFKYYNWTINGLGFNQNRFHESFTEPTQPNALEQEINIEGDNTKVDINNNYTSAVPNSFENFIESSK